MAVFCNPDTLVTIVRSESVKEDLEAQGYVMVRGDSAPGEAVEPVKAPKKAKKGQE